MESCYSVIVLALAATAAHADVVTLDPPSIPDGSRAIDTWHEAGYTLHSPRSRFAHSDSGSSDRRPDNGTAYGQTLFGSAPVVLTADSGALFRVIAMDLAEYSTVADNAEFVQFLGLYQDGSAAEISIELDGVIDGTGPLQDFEHFQFPPEFTSLVSLALLTDACSFDNIELLIVPAPTAASALGLAATCMASTRRRR